MTASNEKQNEKPETPTNTPTRLWRFLRTDHRIGRTEYIATVSSILAIGFAAVALGGALSGGLKDAESDAPDFAMAAILLTVGILNTWAYFAASFKRGKDFGLYPVLSGLLGVFCIGALILAAVPGDKAENQYGLPPR